MNGFIKSLPVHPRTGKLHIAYDKTLMRPGCVLLQATLGGTPNVAEAFDTKTWLLAPTPDLKLWSCTHEDLERIVALTKVKSP